MDKNIAEKRVLMFSGALELIKDPDVLRFTKNLIACADDYFFVAPASSTGKHHPAYANETGGLAKHSMAVAMILKPMLDSGMYDFTERQQDLLIMAAIVHDIKKYGDGNSAYTTKTHPEDACEYIQSIYNSSSNITIEELRFVLGAVLTHMGQWGNVRPSTEEQKLLHLADIISSRKHVQVVFEPRIEWNPKQLLSPKTEEDGEYIVDFGKYKGEKIKDLPEDYRKWILLEGDTNAKMKANPVYIHTLKYVIM